jgi:hypothetical protein
MRAFARRYGATLVLAVLWLAFVAGHFVAGWHAYVEEQTAHYREPAFADYLIQWGRDTLENIQSEVFQIILAAWTFKHFLWKGSPESKEEE